MRDLEVNESRVLSDLQRKARQARKPMSIDLMEEDNGKKVKKKLEVTFDRTGDIMLLTSKIDGLTVHDGREWFIKQVLAVHGECQLRNHTGRFLRSVRDPNVQRPSAKEAARMTPKPLYCDCKTWGGPEAGVRHHPACQWNGKAPAEERAEMALEALASSTATEALPGKPSILDIKPRERVIAPSAVLAPISTTPSPEECDQGCSAWAKTSGSVDGQHHPICKHFDAWSAISTRATDRKDRMFLVSLGTGEPSREATAEEVREAAGEKGFVVIGGEEFAVVPESEIEKRVA